MAENSSRNPPVFIFILIVLLVGYKTFFHHLFDRTIYRAEGFSVKKPEGWSMTKDKFSVNFMSSEKDAMTEMPVAFFSIYSEKQTGALFMDDFFPEVLSSLQRERGKILETGEELIDGQKARWVLFRYDEPDVAMISLFIADDYNRLTRIQFVGTTKVFKAYGKQFDDFKHSIKLKKGLGMS